LWSQARIIGRKAFVCEEGITLLKLVECGYKFFDSLYFWVTDCKIVFALLRQIDRAFLVLVFSWFNVRLFVLSWFDQIIWNDGLANRLEEVIKRISVISICFWWLIIFKCSL
jgi:hypothetical protein